jgi:hypothetical protein
MKFNGKTHHPGPAGMAWHLLGPALMASTVVACGDYNGADEGDWELGSTAQELVTARPSDLDPDRVLLVRHVDVVDNDKSEPQRTVDPCMTSTLADGNRHWTFGYLLQQMAAKSWNGARNRPYSASELAIDWLSKWANVSQVWATPAPGAVPFNPSSTLAETVEPERTPNHPAEVADNVPQMVLDRWRKASCLQARNTDIEAPNADSVCPPATVAATPLAMNRAPFRLLAIVNRPDLRSPRYFGEGNAGELRFVFQILDPLRRYSVDDVSCAGMNTPVAGGGTDNADNQLIILEYAANKSDPKAYARQWEALNAFEPPTEAYRTRLQAITDGIVNAGAAPKNASQSALIRIRTNTTVDNGTWFLREFMIATNTLLVPVEVKQTPMLKFDNKQLLTDWANANSAPISQQTHLLPSKYAGQFFRGLKSENLAGASFWTAAVPSDVRHKLSVNTCSGCHSRETGSPFSHVHARVYDSGSTISSFLSGFDDEGQPYQVEDPLTHQLRPFHALADRQTSMWNLIYR